MTHKELAEKYNIKLTVTRVPFRTDFNNEWDSQAKHFMYKLEVTQGDNFGAVMIGQYSQGSAIKGQPQIDDILNSLALDTKGIESTSFELWAGDYGYSEDSIKALETYKACLNEYKELKKLFGVKGLEELYAIESL